LGGDLVPADVFTGGGRGERGFGGGRGGAGERGARGGRDLATWARGEGVLEPFSTALMRSSSSVVACSKPMAEGELGRRRRCAGQGQLICALSRLRVLGDHGQGEFSGFLRRLASSAAGVRSIDLPRTAFTWLAEARWANRASNATVAAALSTARLILFYNDNDIRRTKSRHYSIPVKT
jgi:hypothetical protein